MKIKYLFTFLCFLPLFITISSCEAFFTTSWFQGVADYSDISVDEAISSGDPEIMAELFDRIIEEAADATGEEAAELYIEAAELALGISGLNDASSLLEATEVLSEGSGNPEDLFSIFTNSDFDLDALEDVAVMIANAEASDPGSVPPDMWLFAAAGSAAAVTNEANDAGLTVDEFLSDDPVADNPDVKQAVQSLVYAMEILPEDLQTQLLDNQADLISKGVVFP
ncbi:hypothetical protein [Spirochaeta isovalerica]|uniref:Lipoprotein n=1 Tax=Spirochaeta isovalerica TaxID=150 RepID=A0A841R9Q7_9SPIO|nr:hypothetical protein [Spirochaeta isovalerica]MBB6480633.1 hypothetical protein [Spirochaeta isovalerica]